MTVERFSVEMDTDRPDLVIEEIERHLSVIFHRPVKAARVIRSGK